MASSKLSENLMGREVERLFGEISAKRGDLCTNPVTGGEFVYGFEYDQTAERCGLQAAPGTRIFCVARSTRRTGDASR